MSDLPHFPSSLTAHRNLMGEAIQQTRLSDDPAETLPLSTRDDVLAAARQHPESSMVWALLAEQELAHSSDAGDVTAYAFARTGYHRGLDALRRHGWRGAGPVPWEHEPNQGFLRALWALAVASERIGDTAEADRCAQFLRDSSETAWTTLVGN